MFRSKFLILAIMLVASACYYDKEDVLYPGSGECTIPTTLSFKTDVLPILDNRCNSCHAGTSPSGSISLANYTDVMKSVSNGSLMGSINWTPGFSAMPKSSGKIPSCEIQKIQTWIDQGALNN